MSTGTRRCSARPWSSSSPEGRLGKPRKLRKTGRGRACALAWRVSRFSPSEPAGLRVCRLSVFLRASSGVPTVPTGGRTPRHRRGSRVARRPRRVGERWLLPADVGRRASRRGDRRRGGRAPRRPGRARSPRAPRSSGASPGSPSGRRVSRSWSVAPDAAPLEAERTLVYAGAAAAAFLTVPRRRAGSSCSACSGARRSRRSAASSSTSSRAGVPNDRLEPPVGYANAIGHPRDDDDPPRPRSGSDGASLARGARRRRRRPCDRRALPLALARVARRRAIGLVVLLATSRSTGVGRIVLAGIPCGVALVLARVGSFGDPGFSGGEAASLLVLGCPRGRGGGARRCGRPRSGCPRASRRVAVAAVAGVAAVGVVVVGVREVREARAAPAAQQGAPDRLLSTSTSSRGDYWGVALAMVGREPLLGEGAGSYERAWIRERPALLYVRRTRTTATSRRSPSSGRSGSRCSLSALGIPLLAVRRCDR